MATGVVFGASLRRVGRAARVLGILGAAALVLAGCSSLGKGDSGGSGESWTCFKTKDEKEPCQCQTTPVGGKPELVDHCDRDSVQTGAGPADAECCKNWLLLNGKRVSAPYCSCYVNGTRSCDAAIGDEIVDSCP
jgi:hypothetical protein